MDIFIQQVVSGLATGGIYASLALALVMIYQATDVVNFAQGEMAMFSTYLAWSMLNRGAPYWLAFALTVAIAFVGGLAIERLIIRPVENAPVLAIVIVTLGLPLRAAAQNPAGSRLVGIRVGWMLALGWGLAALIGAVAGMMVAPIIFLEPNMMSGILIYAFASATLGGFTSPGGAVLGGFLVGVIENLAGTYVRFIGTDLKLTLALLVIIVVLLVKPSGLFGQAVVRRV